MVANALNLGGQWKEAELKYVKSQALYERACTAYSTVLGEDHPTTRACRRHHSEMLASQMRSLVIFPLAITDNVHAGKVSRLSQGLVKLGIRSTKHNSR
jgi:hypothetical protein